MKLFGSGCLVPELNGGVHPVLRSCTWKPIATSKCGPQGRNHHAVCITERYLYMYGGRGVHGTQNDFWKYGFDTESWSSIKPAGERPPPLEGHSIVEYDGDLYMFGGENSFASAGEVPLWKFSIKLCTWRKLEGTDDVSPTGRREHVAVRYRNFLCVHGGYVDLKGPTNEMWMYSFNDDTWDQVEAASSEHSPVARYKHAGVVHSDFLWICGGLMGITDKNETQVWTWCFLSYCWSQIRTRGAPSQLFNHAVCVVDDEVFIFGGNQENGKPGSKLWKAAIDEVESTGFQNWKHCQFQDKLVPSSTCNSCFVLMPEPVCFSSEKELFKSSKLLRSDLQPHSDEKNKKSEVRSNMNAISTNFFSPNFPIMEVKPFSHKKPISVEETADVTNSSHAQAKDIDSSHLVNENVNSHHPCDHLRVIDDKQSLLPSGMPFGDTDNNTTLFLLNGKGDLNDSKSSLDIFDDIGCETADENLLVFESDKISLVPDQKKKLPNRLNHLDIKTNENSLCNGFNNPTYDYSPGLHEAETVKRFSYNLSATQVPWQPLQKKNSKFATTSFIEAEPHVEEKANQPPSKNEVRFINDGAGEKIVLPDIFVENARLLDQLENNIVHKPMVTIENTLSRKSDVSLFVIGGKKDRSSRALGKQGISMWKCHITYEL